MIRDRSKDPEGWYGPDTRNTTPHDQAEARVSLLHGAPSERQAETLRARGHGDVTGRGLRNAEVLS